MKTYHAFTRSVQEAEVAEAAPAAPYEAMVFLGHNQQKKLTWKNGVPIRASFRPSLETRIAALAAGIAYTQGFTKKIVFTGGMTGPQSEAQLMRNRLRYLFRDIPDEDVLLEPTSLDTTENAIQVKQLLERYNIHSHTAALATNEFHLPRAKEIFRRQGMEFARTYSTELLIRDTPGIPHGTLLRPLMDTYLRSRRVRVTKLSEYVLKTLLTFDRQGRIPRALAHILRKQ